MTPSQMKFRTTTKGAGHDSPAHFKENYIVSALLVF
jgi:hypothetical protein